MNMGFFSPNSLKSNHNSGVLKTYFFGEYVMATHFTISQLYNVKVEKKTKSIELENMTSLFKINPDEKGLIAKPNKYDHLGLSASKEVSDDLKVPRELLLYVDKTNQKSKLLDSSIQRLLDNNCQVLLSMVWVKLDDNIMQFIENIGQYNLREFKANFDYYDQEYHSKFIECLGKMRRLNHLFIRVYGNTTGKYSFGTYYNMNTHTLDRLVQCLNKLDQSGYDEALSLQNEYYIIRE